jgi:gliding motility-associated-like protein
MYSSKYVNDIIALGLIFLVCLGSSKSSAQALVNNNGALISIKDSALVIVKTNSVNNEEGYISNAGRFIIEEDFINTDTATGGLAKGRYEVERHWENSGVFIADSSTVELYGANQLITGDSVTEFHHLQLTGTGIKTQTLDAKVNSHLELNDRELATDTSKMFVINPSVRAITRTTGFVSSLADGRLSRDMDRDTSYLFPVGSSQGVLRYRPIVVTSPIAAPKTFEVRMANVDATTEGFDRTVTANDICEINPEFYHLIDTTAGSGAVDLTFFFDPAVDGNWNEVAHWESVPQWESTRPNPAGTVGSFSTLAITGWDTYEFEAYALSIPSPTIDSAFTKNITCFGGEDGVIDVDVITGTPDFTYDWSIPGVTTDSVGSLTAGDYSLTISDVNGCENSYDFELTEADSIALRTSATDVLCFEGATGSASVDPLNPVEPYNVIWSNQETGNSITGVEAGTYTVELTDSNNCKAEATIEIEEPTDLLVSTDYFDVSCLGAGDGEASVSVDGGVPDYNIEWNNGSNELDIDSLSGGVYIVSVTDSNNCAKVDTVEIFEPDEVEVEASEDITISLGNSTDLEAIYTAGGTPGYDYSWTPNTGLDSDNGEFVVATPDSTTEYIVTAVDVNGCAKRDTVVVTVNATLYVFPEGFTPNGDGSNDTYDIIRSDGVDVLRFDIYNRWGELIFSDNSGSWDGRYKGSLQAMDTYLFQAELQLPNGERVSEAGDFVLVQ